MELSEEKLNKLKGSLVLIKYGGNAMVDEQAQNDVINDIVKLKEKGLKPVLVHGGGPAIKSLLAEVGIQSEFIGGHRKTDEKSMRYVEMALRGQVNSKIVKLLNARGQKAVGVSGKDGGMVTASKRMHREEVDGKMQEKDLGHVGDVFAINTQLIEDLLEKGYIPVIAPIGVGEDGLDYNINADMFAGHMAGALKAGNYLVLTDVDGLRKDKDDPATLISNISVEETKKQMGKIIQGGMIPKVESCVIALEKGVKHAHIINGMKAGSIFKELLGSEGCGTRIEA